MYYADASRFVEHPDSDSALSDSDQISNHCYEAGKTLLYIQDARD